MTDTPASNLNPFLSIWTKPRQTMRQILQEPRDRALEWGLLALSGACSGLVQALSKPGISDHKFIIVLLTVVISAVATIFISYLISWVVARVGRIFKGKATTLDVFRASAWACIPYFLASLLLFIPLVFPDLSVISFLSLAVSLWSSIIWIFCLAEVQGFGFWAAFGNLFIAGLLIMIPIVILVLLFAAGSLPPTAAS